MPNDTVITLVSEVYAKNDFGVDSATEESRTVLCRSRSVSRTDFFSAGQMGLSIEHVFLIQPVNYNGEKIVIFNGNRYSVLRTYQASEDELEIYVGYKAGVTNVVN